MNLESKTRHVFVRDDIKTIADEGKAYNGRFFGIAVIKRERFVGSYRPRRKADPIVKRPSNFALPVRDESKIL